MSFRINKFWGITIAVFLFLALLNVFNVGEVLDSMADADEVQSTKNTSGVATNNTISNLKESDFYEYFHPRHFSYSGPFEINYGTIDLGSARWVFEKHASATNCKFKLEVFGKTASSIYRVHSFVECVDEPQFSSVTQTHQSKVLEIALKDDYSDDLANWMARSTQGQSVNDQRLENLELLGEYYKDVQGETHSLTIRVKRN
jgi:hypothetical protein